MILDIQKLLVIEERMLIADLPNSPIKNKNIVFTGEMASGNRSSIQKQARRLGAKVQATVRSSAHFLITGMRPSSSKLQKAKKYNVTILTEQEYLEMIAKINKV